MVDKLVRTKSGCYVRQIREGSKADLYEVRYNEIAPISGYEVWTTKRSPNNEEFGKLAWSWCTLEQANKCFEQINKS
jgi:hypothetical protein